MPSLLCLSLRVMSKLAGLQDPQWKESWAGLAYAGLASTNNVCVQEYRQADTQPDRQAGRKAEIQIDRQRERERESPDLH